MKKLIINGKEYAKYEIEGDILYLKVLDEMEPHEDVIISMISIVEKRQFSASAYLNV